MWIDTEDSNVHRNRMSASTAGKRIIILLQTINFWISRRLFLSNLYLQFSFKRILLLLLALPILTYSQYSLGCREEHVKKIICVWRFFIDICGHMIYSDFSNVNEHEGVVLWLNHGAWWAVIFRQQFFTK